MAKDDIAICNLALSRIGSSEKIDSLANPRTPEQIELNCVFEDVRERVLAAVHWPFCRKVARLQLTGDTPIKWGYRYEYPNDCLAIRYLYPEPTGVIGAGFRQWVKMKKIPYELELDGNSRTICTDLENAIIEYTVRVTDPLLFDAYFTSAFAWALASEIALPLAKTPEHAINAAKAYDLEIANAIVKALKEESHDERPDSEFVLARL